LTGTRDDGEHPIRRHFRIQASACGRLGSPFYERFIARCADLIQDRSRVEAAVLGWEGDPFTDAVALRLAGALRFLVLRDAAPELASLFPPQGDGALDEEDWTRIRAALVRHEVDVLAFIASPPQTNEIGRCCALLGGFLEIARRFGSPLALYEIGASAGLNLLWDQWRYRGAHWTWGSPSAPLCLDADWQGDPPPAVAATVASRHACDLRPLDLRRRDHRLRLLSYVWPDQADRLARAETAIACFLQSGLEVEQDDAVAWLGRCLPARREDAIRVVYQSIFVQYLSEARRGDLETLVRERGSHADVASPLAWLRLEPSPYRPWAMLTLTAWPGGTETALAECDFHGRWVKWLRP
jgi:hypothetical protein